MLPSAIQNKNKKKTTGLQPLACRQFEERQNFTNPFGNKYGFGFFFLIFLRKMEERAMKLKAIKFNGMNMIRLNNYHKRCQFMYKQ